MEVLLIPLGTEVSKTSCIHRHLDRGCCLFLGTAKYGQVSFCNLFQQKLAEKAGRVQRCSECLSYQRKEKEEGENECET